MAGKKENLKALFTNTRSRVIIIFTGLLLLIAVIIGILKFSASGEKGPSDTADLTNAPVGIQSVPGGLNQTVQYARLQQEQNITQAKKALKTGASAIPTIIHAQSLNNGVIGVGSAPGLGSLGFTTLSQEEQGGTRHNEWFQELNSGRCSPETIKSVRSQGANVAEIKQSCTCAELLAGGYLVSDLEKICSCTDLKAAGIDLGQMKAAGYDASRLRLCGFNACVLHGAGFSAQAMKEGGFTDGELKGAGFSNQEIEKALSLPDGITKADVRKMGCRVAGIEKLRSAGVSAIAIRHISGCSAALLKQAGYTPSVLNSAGFSPAEVTVSALGAKNCNVTALKKERANGVSASTIRQTWGCSASALREAGFTLAELKEAGFTAAELELAGFTPGELEASGFTSAELPAINPLGFNASGLSEPVIAPSTSTLEAMPGAPSQVGKQSSIETENAKHLQSILSHQNERLADQQVQQQIQQRTSDMYSVASQLTQRWQQVSTQTYVAGAGKATSREDLLGTGILPQQAVSTAHADASFVDSDPRHQKIYVKTGDIMFAVIDTSINSDQPGPILATIVSGKLKGSKLIGSFTMPQNADKMVISFNTLSVPGITHSTSISAFAIDPNTARTALASRVDHHYLMRYGSLFASSFMQGIGNAFQSADTTVTVGGTGGGNNITVQNGINRSTLENAVIALSQVGQAWSQATQQLFNTPTTVDVYSGTGIGVLFTQDLTAL